MAMAFSQCFSNALHRLPKLMSGQWLVACSALACLLAKLALFDFVLLSLRLKRPKVLESLVWLSSLGIARFQFGHILFYALYSVIVVTQANTHI